MNPAILGAAAGLIIAKSGETKAADHNPDQAKYNALCQGIAGAAAEMVKANKAANSPATAQTFAVPVNVAAFAALTGKSNKAEGFDNPASSNFIQVDITADLKELGISVVRYDAPGPNGEMNIVAYKKPSALSGAAHRVADALDHLIHPHQK